MDATVVVALGDAALGDAGAETVADMTELDVPRPDALGVEPADAVAADADAVAVPPVGVALAEPTPVDDPLAVEAVLALGEPETLCRPLPVVAALAVPLPHADVEGVAEPAPLAEDDTVPLGDCEGEPEEDAHSLPDDRAENVGPEEMVAVDGGERVDGADALAVSVALAVDEK